MSRRASDLIGKPVVSAVSGEQLGSVADLLLDDSGTSLLAVVVRHGWLKREDVLPASSLQTLGPDAVVARSTELVGAQEWRTRQHRFQSTSEAYGPVSDGSDRGSER
jgi:uncharacterized protein YrrD